MKRCNGFRLRFAAISVVFLMFGLSGPIAAAVTITLETHIPAETAIVDSDDAGAFPSTHRNGLRSQTEVEFSIAAGAYSGQFRVRAEIQTGDGTPVPMVGGTEFSDLEIVTLNAMVPGQESAVVVFEPAPVPVAPLDTSERYRIVATLQEQTSPGNWSDLPHTDTTDAVFIPHFTSLDPLAPELHVLGTLGDLDEPVREWLLDTSPSDNGIPVDVDVTLVRYDAWDQSTPGSDIIDYRVRFELETMAGVSVPLENDGMVSGTLTMSEFIDAGAGALPLPDWQPFTVTTQLVPLDQLDSVNGEYRIRATLEHIELPGFPNDWTDHAERSVEDLQFLHFNGDLLALNDPVFLAVFSSIVNNPERPTTYGSTIPLMIAVPIFNAIIPDSPGLSFGGNLNIALLESGEAQLQFGVHGVQLADPSWQVIPLPGLGMTLRADGYAVTNQGLRANGLRLEFPQGLGVLTGNSRIGQGEIAFPTNPTPVETSRMPKDSVITFSPPAGSRLFDESLALLLPVSQLTLDLDDEFFGATPAGSGPEWVHTDAFVHDGNGSFPVRPSNDGYLNFLDGTPVTGPIELSAASDGSVRSSFAVDLDVGAFTPHFPRIQGQLEWGGMTSLIISDSRISSASTLPDSSPVSLRYQGNCPGDDCVDNASGGVTLELEPQLEGFMISPQGGLAIASPVLGAPIDLEWGYRMANSVMVATHVVEGFTDGEFFMPGLNLMAEDNPLWASEPLLAGKKAAGSLLLGGYDLDTEIAVFYGSGNYSDGIGAYPGINFTAETALDGASLIGDNVDPWEYEMQPGFSKYYVRASGVSGRHAPDQDSFEPELEIYGYNFEFSSYQLTYLSNIMEESWIHGQLAIGVPGDSDYYTAFTQDFLGLELDCTGQLENALIDPNDADPKPLAYWIGEFTPLALSFKAVGDPAACPVPPRRAVFGASLEVAQVPNTLYGRLGFSPTDANILREADNVAGVYGEIPIPGQITLPGPQSEVYRVTPTTALRFNNPTQPDQPGVGFVNFGGTVRVPFFRDLRAHIITSAQASSPNLFLAAGWEAGGETMFTDSRFDPAHMSWPGSGSGLDLAEYRNPNEGTDPDYIMRAEQTLLGIIDLSYPVLWQVPGAYFRSIPNDPQGLLVIEIEHHLDYLSARFAELNFGLRWDGMPKLNLANMLIDAADEQLGAAQAFVSAGLDHVSSTLGGGIDAAGDLLADSMEGLFNEVFDHVAAQIYDPLYEAVAAWYVPAAEGFATVQDFRNQFQSQMDFYLVDSTETVTSLLEQELAKLKNYNEQGISIVDQVDENLTSMILMIDAIIGEYRMIDGAPYLDEPEFSSGDLVRGLLAKNAFGDRDLGVDLIVNLIIELVGPEIDGLVQPLAGQLTAELNDLLAKLWEKSEPTLERVEEILLDIRERLVFLQTELVEPTGEFLGKIKAIIEKAESMNVFAEIGQQISDEVHEILDRLFLTHALNDFDALGDYPNLFLELDKEEFKELLRDELRDALLVMGFVEEIKQELKQRLYDIDLAVRSAVDGVFAEISGLIKVAIQDTIGALEDEINPMLGDVSKYVGTGDISGYVQFEGDSVRRLRLDGEFEFQVPDEMSLSAFLEIFVFRSGEDFPESACLKPGQTALEATIGANSVPLDWVSPDLKADLSVKLSFTDGFPTGIAGNIKTIGELEFQKFTITKLIGGVAVGSRDSYLALGAGLIFSDYDLSGNIFFGRTCSLAPLEMLDADVASIVGSPPFTGAYVYGEIWLPISETLLGIPATCMFKISAGVGAGAFYFAEGPTYGGQLLLGATGEALCLVTITGEIRMIGRVRGGDIAFSGSGRIAGEVGVCPLCTDFDKSVKITYENDSWSVDL
jgi:AcrR family transcriptional regulator